MADLHLSQLQLSYFRSHKRTVLNVDPSPVAIHGPNGAGKTNLLEAISMLSPGRGLRRAKTHEIARQSHDIGWKVSAQLNVLGHLHELETRFDGNGTRHVMLDGKSVPQMALGRVARIVWLVPVMDRLWLEGAEGRRRFLDRITLSFIPKHGEVSTTYDRAMRERNRMIKDGVNDPSWFDAVEDQMAQAGAIIEQNRLDTIARILSAQDQNETSFPAADLILIGPEQSDVITDADILRKALGAGRTRDMAAGRTLVGPHRSDLRAHYRAKSLPAEYCSTGEQKALLVNLILSSARALNDAFGAPPILLLDEIAAHLDTARRGALYSEICALGAQAWMTGTGFELFSELGERATHLAVSECETGSMIERISI